MKPNRLSRRGFLKLTGVTTMGAVLAACAPALTQTGNGMPAREIVLRFLMWNTFAPDADDALEQGVLAWGEENGVTVEITRESDGNRIEKIMPAVEAGTLPDAFIARPGDALQMFEVNAIDPLNELFVDVGEAHGGWMPRLPEYATRAGDTLFMPYSIDPFLTYYRQDILEEAGIQVPEGQWTWDETRDLAMQAQTYTEEQGDKKIGWGFGVVKQQHDGWCDDLFRNFGADLWDTSGERIILKEEASDEATRALLYAKDAWDMGLFPDDAAAWDWSSNNKGYQEGRIILTINGAAIYFWLANNKPELAEVTGLALKPSDVRDTTDTMVGNAVVMSSGSQNKDAASDLIRGLYGSSIYAPWIENGFMGNVLQEYNDLPIWEGKRSEFNTAANIGVYPGYPAPFDNAAISELNGPNAPVGSMTVRVLIDDWRPDEAIDEADAFARRVFQKHFS
jgi:ABC-type glycerol-3-phosphate transport system substrate-binding protein